VTTAANGQEAIDWLMDENHYVDVVLMDIQMPVLDGLEAARKLREQARFADLPIIALSAGVANEEREHVRESGMNAFLSKPLDLAKALITIRAELSRKRGSPLGNGRRKDGDDDSVLPEFAVHKNPPIKPVKRKVHSPHLMSNMLDHMSQSLRAHYANVSMISSKAHIEQAMFRSLEALERATSMIGEPELAQLSKELQRSFLSHDSEAIHHAALTLADAIDVLRDQIVATKG